MSFASVSRFASEPFNGVLIDEVGVQDLERDAAVERFVDGHVDRAHTASANLIDNAVFPNRAAEHGSIIPASWHVSKAALAFSMARAATKVRLLLRFAVLNICSKRRDRRATVGQTALYGKITDKKGAPAWYN